MISLPDATSEVPLESGSPAMRPVVEMLAAVAAHDVPVLLRGESGVGKSVLARALHTASPRRAFPLVTIDCRGLEGDEATAAKVLGPMLRGSSPGNALLEEIGALPERAQAILAMLLEGNRGAGGLGPRIIGTSARDLEAAVRAGRFRRDLLARLSVVEIRVPSLRERREDILPLASRFLSAFSPSPRDLSPRAREALLLYDWPGNVRELRNAIQHAVVLCDGPSLDLPSLPERVTGLKKALSAFEEFPRGPKQ